MKSFLKIVTSILLVIVVIIGGLYFYFTTAMTRESKHGEKENTQIANVEKLNDKLTITYMGDSLTNGYNSGGKLVPDNMGYRSVIDEKLKAAGKYSISYNYAVGGYTTDDLLKQVKDDVQISEVNKVIQTKTDNEQVRKNYPTNVSDDKHLSQAISDSDILILTVGANDVLKAISYDEKTQAMNIDIKGLLKILNETHEKKLELFAKLHEINPDLKIYDVGMYFSYPYIDEGMMKKMYPLLCYAETRIFINKPLSDIYRVRVRDNIQANIRNYVDDPNDIHPNLSGYKIMGNEILKKIIETN